MIRKNGLTSSFIIIILFIIIFISVSISIILRQQTIKATNNQVNISNKLILSTLDWAISPLLKQNDILSVQRLLENTGSSSAIKNIELFNFNNIVIASSNLANIGVLKENKLVTSIFEKNSLYESDKNTYAVPIKGGKYNTLFHSDVEAVLVIESEKSYYLKLYEPLNRAVLIASVILAIFLSVFSLLFFSESILKPINFLIFAINDVENGNYAPDIKTKGPYEILRLGVLFKNMLLDINEKNKKLIEYSGELELKVKERTFILENTISELKDTQKKLVQSEKMASIGQLASGIAHEINNPTGFVNSNLETLKEYSDLFKQILTLIAPLLNNEPFDLEDIRSNLQALNESESFSYILDDLTPIIMESLDGTRRIHDIVQGLQNFARVDITKYEQGNINDLVKDALHLTWNELKYKCELKEKLSPVPDLLLNKNQITQVFINMLINAVGAIKSHGIITIKTSTKDGFIVVEITDNGSGITKENISKLFDPFFTTKDVGKGTGLGLSISLGIVEKHNGTIEVESKEGEGTTFIIKFLIV
jgi:signal transduction histidine kinase